MYVYDDEYILWTSMLCQFVMSKKSNVQNHSEVRKEVRIKFLLFN